MSDTATADALGFNHRSTFEAANAFRDNCSSFRDLVTIVTPAPVQVIDKEVDK